MEPEVVIKFAPNQKIPPGYLVVWSDLMEMYYAFKIDGSWESGITWNRFQARRYALNHYNKERSAVEE